MKKILIIAAAVLAFAGCAKEAAQIDRVTIDGKEFMTFKVVANDDVVSADTKATLTRGGVFGWSDGETIYFVKAGGTVATGTFNESAGTITVEADDWIFASNAPFDSDSKIKDFGLANGPVVIAKVAGSTLSFHHIGSVINIKFDKIPIDGYLEFWPNDGTKWHGGEFDFSGDAPELMGMGTDDIYIKKPIKKTDAGKDITLSVPNVNYEGGFTVALSGTTTKYFQKSTSKDFDLSTRPTLLNMQELTLPTYTVAGEQTEFFGSYWKWDDANNDMVLGADGKYRKTYKHTPNQLIFKVCENHAWENGKWPDATNYEHTVTKPTGGATIIFDRGNNSISVEEFDIYTVVGNTELCGTFWGDIWTETYVNDMEEVSDGVYYKKFTGVPAGDYQFKVVENHSWDNTWGIDGSDFPLTTTADGDVEIYFYHDHGFIGVVGYANRFYVAGNDANIFSGKSWVVNAVENLMTFQADGNYRISYAIPDTDDYDELENAIAAFKITQGDWENAWPASNYEIKVVRGKTLTITFNPLSHAVSAVVE